MQTKYMPAVAELLLEGDSNAEHVEVENIKLWMPSELETDLRKECRMGLDTTEEVLRLARCRDALARLHSIKQIKLSLVQF